MNRMQSRPEQSGDAPDAVKLWAGEVDYLLQAYEQDESFQQRFALWTTLIDRYTVSGARTVDIGCGTGVFVGYLARQGCRVLGMDPAMEMLVESRRQLATLGAKRAREVHLVQAALPALPWSPVDAAQLILCSSVLEYVPSLATSLRPIADRLASGGILLISMPNLLSLARSYYRLKHLMRGEPEIYAYIRHFVTPGGLARLMKSLGLQLLEYHYYAYGSRVSRLLRRLYVPESLAADLFVAAFRK